MNCKVCGSPEQELVPLWNDALGPWFRCVRCGSDSSTRGYADVRHYYDADYVQHNVRALGSREAMAESMRCNLDWFQSFRAPNRQFLDIGCNEGCGLDGMAARGWSVHGFDVIPEASTGTHVTIAPEFRAELMPVRFGAILCREVIEHIENWREFLDQVRLCLERRGLFQIQTVRPWMTNDGIIYQPVHLQIFSPHELRRGLQEAGFRIIAEELFPRGQKYMVTH